jgi:hypothetical protein
LNKASKLNISFSKSKGSLGEEKPTPPYSSFNSKGDAQKHFEPGIIDEPKEFTATKAPKFIPLSSFIDAEPRPPFKFEVVAPVPAPTVPSLKNFPLSKYAFFPREE